MVLGGLSSCEHVVDPPLPPGASQFAPPALYELWWKMTESCAGQTGAIDGVRWYEAPGTFELDDEAISAYWSAGTNQIVLHTSVVRNPRVVRHEMLHALLQTKGHPRAAFVDNCGGLVTCSASCLRDGGAAPSPNPFNQRVPSSAISVTSVLDPATPSISQNEGYFSLTVRATNSRSFPVVVTLGGTPGIGVVGFSAVLGGDQTALYSVSIPDSSAVMFEPGETKIHVFDFFGGTALGVGMLPAGQYTLTGRYGGQPASAHSFGIVP
jgi:hypothetical protein